MQILKYLDILIGLAVVMVLMSPLVTAVTSAVMWAANRRSAHLRAAVIDLIRQVDGTKTNLSVDVASRLGDAVLQHPMVDQGPASPLLRRILLPFRRFGAQVIEREELIRILLQLAGRGTVASLVSNADRRVLTAMLAANGIHNPDATLDKIRVKAQQLERDKPQEAAHVRQAEAILRASQSNFVGTINSWFDQTMARSEEHTSELQSRGHLVCRLLLEKKKDIPEQVLLTETHKHDNAAFG